MRIYRILLLTVMAALACSATVLLPVTSGEVDVFGHGFSVTGSVADATASIVSGTIHLVQEADATPIYSCTPVAPCAPGSPIPASLLGPSSSRQPIFASIVDFNNHNFAFQMQTGPGQNSFADVELEFDLTVPADAQLGSSLAVRGPFTAIAFYRNPSQGVDYEFIGQGTATIALLPIGSAFQFQSARFVFTPVPEPSLTVAVFLALLALAARRSASGTVAVGR
jgi:hypothetical protein